MTMEKITLTRKEAAAIFGISTATVTQWVKTGRLRAFRISGKEKSRCLFTREDCIAALKHGQVAYPSHEALLTQVASPTPPAVGNPNKNDVAKRLEEMLRQRSTNAKRRSNE